MFTRFLRVLKLSYNIHHSISCYGVYSDYGLSKIEPSHSHLEHPWEALGSVNWFWALPLIN